MAHSERVRKIVHGAEVFTSVLMIVLVWVISTVRWLIGSALGVFVLVLSCYLYLRHFGPIRPLSATELLSWFDAQGYEIKLGIAGALLTVLGFAIAFWTATATWTRQKELELRVEAHKAILTRYPRAIRLLSSIETYFHVVTSAMDALPRPDLPDAQKVAGLAFANSQAHQFLQQRQDLYTTMYDVYDLGAEFSAVFNNVAGVREDLQVAERAIEQAQSIIGQLFPPMADANDPAFVQTFQARCSLAAIRSAHTECARYREFASTVYGRAAGKLVAEIVRPNLWALLGLTRVWRQLGRFTLLGHGSHWRP